MIKKEWQNKTETRNWIVIAIRDPIIWSLRSTKEKDKKKGRLTKKKKFTRYDLSGPKGSIPTNIGLKIKSEIYLFRNVLIFNIWEEIHSFDLLLVLLMN